MCENGISMILNLVTFGHLLCHTWLVFTWSPYPWSLVEITHVLATFCGDYLSVHYFYVPWLIMTSQWITRLLGIPIMASQWVMMLLGTSIVMSQWVMTFLWTSFAMYYYAKLCYCCFISKLFKIVHINH